jgi:hypothetical protein
MTTELAIQPETSLISYGPQPEAEYHADYSHWSQSMLATFHERRRMAEAQYILRTHTPEETPAMRKGTLLHAAILEPYRVNELVVAYPKELLASNGAASTIAAKQFAAEQTRAGRVVMKTDEFEQVRLMAESVKRVCGRWLELPCALEHVVRWRDFHTGLPLKARLDWIIPANGQVFVFDLKSTSKITPAGFAYACEDFRYWLQDAQYRAAVHAATGEWPEFHFVAVENEFPYQCAIYTLDEETRRLAAQAREKLLHELADCLDSGNFAEPWEETVTALSLRPWKIDQSLSINR